MRISRTLGGNKVEVESLTGVGDSLAFQFWAGGVLQDISGLYPLVEFYPEPADQVSQLGTPTLASWTITNGHITRDDPTSTFTLVVSGSDFTALGIGSFGFGFYLFSDAGLTTCVERPTWGRWVNKGGR